MAGDDFDTEEFDTFQKLYDKYGDKQSWFNKTDGESMFNKYKEMTGRPFKVKTRKGENGAIYDSVFGESKVDKVISKYFEVSKSEIREQKEKQVQQTLKKKSDVKKIMESVVKMTETIEQELAAKRYLQENLNSKFVGITNKKNLVFENKGGQVRITPNGDLI
jgi:organic radical activating enzyme